MDPEDLIAAVQERPGLYDKTHPNYSNRKYINAEWKKIGEKLGSSGDVARKRWKKLRDYFQKNHRATISNDSGSGGSKRRKWYLYGNLVFLLPHLTDRKTDSNMLASSDEDVPDNDESRSLSAPIKSPPTPEEANDQCHGRETSTVPVHPLPENEPRNCCRRPIFPQECLAQADIDSRIITAITDIGNKALNKDVQTVDEDEYFFKNLIPKMKLLNLVDKMECQAEIHMTVLRYIKRSTEETHQKAAEKSGASSNTLS